MGVEFSPLYELQVFHQARDCCSTHTGAIPASDNRAMGEGNLAGLYSSTIKLCFPDLIEPSCSVFY